MSSELTTGTMSSLKGIVFAGLMAFAACGPCLATLSRPLPEAEAEANRNFAEQVRVAAAQCAAIKIIVPDGSDITLLSAADKAVVCDIFRRATPVQKYSLVHIWQEQIDICFVAADGSDIMAVSNYDFGCSQTGSLTESGKILLSEADDKRLREILSPYY